jgi:hypothetical protein
MDEENGYEVLKDSFHIWFESKSEVFQMMQNTKYLQYWEVKDHELEINVLEDQTMCLSSN